MTKKPETIFKEIRNEEREAFEVLLEEMWDEGLISSDYVRGAKELISMGLVNPNRRWNLRDWVENKLTDREGFKQ